MLLLKHYYTFISIRWNQLWKNICISHWWRWSLNFRWHQCYLCFMCVVFFSLLGRIVANCRLFFSSIYHRFQMFIMLIFLEQIGNGSVPLNISLGNCWHTSSFSEATLEISLGCSFSFVGRGRSDYALWIDGNLSKNSRSLNLHSVSKHQ